MDLRGRSLLSITDLSAEEFMYLVDLARELRAEKRFGFGFDERRLAGRNIALIFEKTSTRTRAAFEVAAHHEGAHVSYLGPGETQLGRKESVRDTARVLGRMFDGIEYRGFDQEAVETLAACAGVPVWNGLTDAWHPTQMLADILTITDHCAKPLPTVSLCYLGDGRNNTANSLLVTGGLLGMDMRICAPPALRPSSEVRGIAGRLAQQSGARLTVTSDVRTAVVNADFLYTDVWLSMGEPEEDWAKRIDQLLSYQVNSVVLAATGNPDVKFMHCLPALHDRETGIGRQLNGKRGLTALEVTDEAFTVATLARDTRQHKGGASATLGPSGAGPGGPVPGTRQLVSSSGERRAVDAAVLARPNCRIICGCPGTPIWPGMRTRVTGSSSGWV